VNTLLFDSLETRRFRAFDFLKIEQLGHVNLILGKNNVGKSTVLEALYLHANIGSPHVMLAILAERDEPYSKLYTTEEEPAMWNLFHGRPALEQISDSIQIGRAGAPDSALTFSVMWSPHPDDKHIATTYMRAGPINNTDNSIPAVVIKFGSLQHVLRLDKSSDDLYRHWRIQINADSNLVTPCVFVGPGGLGYSALQTLWKEIALSDAKNDVVDALRIISPEVEDFALFSPRYNAQAFLLRLRDSISPVPVKAMGDGINRLIGLSMALVCSKDGILLVDEIENGIHWSVLPEVWKFIVKVAKRLNVQVFATTHSNDCLKAFQMGTRDDVDMDGVAVRIEKKNGEFNAEIFDEKRLAIIVKEGIEIR
jgi:ABC-type polar amino acid transport system ATPase subunit